MIAPHPYGPVGERIVQGEQATLHTVCLPAQTELEVVCYVFVLFTFCHGRLRICTPIGDGRRTGNAMCTYAALRSLLFRFRENQAELQRHLRKLFVQIVSRVHLATLRVGPVVMHLLHGSEHIFIRFDFCWQGVVMA